MGTLSETLKLQRTVSFSVPSNRPPGPLGLKGRVWRPPPIGLARAMACRKTARLAGTKKRAQRATSNVFAMFDQNRDGFIDHDDLKDMLASLGKDVSDDYLDEMMNQAPGAINFTMFLTLFGERLQGTDPEDVIRNAFGCFDENLVGALNEDYLRELLTTLGDRFTQDEVDDLYKEAPIKNGQFDYVEFTRILKHGAKDPDDK